MRPSSFSRSDAPTLNLCDRPTARRLRLLRLFRQLPVLLRVGDLDGKRTLLVGDLLRLPHQVRGRQGATVIRLIALSERYKPLLAIGSSQPGGDVGGPPTTEALLTPPTNRGCVAGNLQASARLSPS